LRQHLQTIGKLYRDQEDIVEEIKTEIFTRKRMMNKRQAAHFSENTLAHTDDRAKNCGVMDNSLNL